MAKAKVKKGNDHLPMWFWVSVIVMISLIIYAMFYLMIVQGGYNNPVAY